MIQIKQRIFFLNAKGWLIFSHKRIPKNPAIQDVVICNNVAIKERPLDMENCLFN